MTVDLLSFVIVIKENVLTGLPSFSLLVFTSPGSGSVTIIFPRFDALSPGCSEISEAHPSAAASHFRPHDHEKAASVAV